MRTETGQPATGFRMKPAGPFTLRDYSSDDPDSLKALHGLLHDILTHHKLLIPGSMNRLMTQWHADLHRAIEATSDKDEDNPRTESAAP